MKIHSLIEAEQVLAKHIPLVKQITGKDLTLQRMGPLMGAIGNPQQKLKVIHIAGTSGKTSTSYFIASLLQQANQRVGLSISPHIMSVTERIQLDLEPLTDEEFCTELGLFMDELKKSPVEPTYFELLIAFALWYYAKNNIDYVVLETGLGGLHDATNICQRKDKICVITDIGIDHTRILGETLPEIAGQKAGIIHPKNMVFTHRQPDEVLQVFEKKTKSQDASLHVMNDNETLISTKLPIYQQRNWLLAKRVFDYMRARDDLRELTIQELKSSQAVTIPGRMEVIKQKSQDIVLDGAHNEQKMAAFVQAFQSKFRNKKATVIVAIKKEKDYAKVIKLLLPISHKLIITNFKDAQETPFVQEAAQRIADVAREQGFENIAIENNLQKALLSQSEGLVIVTGSLYLVAEARKILV